MRLPKKSLRPCPICNYADGVSLRNQQFLLPENHPLHQGYDVVCCDRCGFVFADTDATQEDYDKFYASFSKYEDNKTSTGSGENPSDAARLTRTAEDIAAFVKDQKARILDMGCANGGLLLALSKLGFENIVGLDLPSGCVDATRKLGFQADFGSVSSWPENVGQFDLIVLSHVMEHLRDVHLAVENMALLLKPNGHLYVEVPNASEYASHVVAPFQDFNTEHINHFSIQCMANLMGRTKLSGHGIGEKIFESSPGMPYPAHFGFWSKDSGADFQIKKDNDLVVRIEKFISISQQMMDTMNARLSAALQKSPRVIVWGTGQLAMKLLVETCLANASIVAFVDGNPINVGKKLRGVEIKSPAAIAGSPEPIIITTTLHQQAIVSRIRNEMRLKNDLILLV